MMTSPQTIHGKYNNHILDCEIFSAVISSSFSYHENRTKSLCSGFKEICKNAFSMSAIKAILFARKRKITESNRSVNEGPGCKQSFNEGPSIFELASNTIRTLDVTRSSLITGLCGK